jgi:phosphate-selective porin OprO/OprP
MRRCLVALFLTAQATAAGAQTPPAAPAGPTPTVMTGAVLPAPRLVVAPARRQVDGRVFPPRLRVGTGWSIEPVVKVQVDLSRFDPVVDAGNEDVLWRRRRFGVKGELFGHVDFEVEREFSDKADPWRDVYIDLKAAGWFAVKAGHFRVPFSLDGLTGSTSHDFVNRSLGGNTIAPGRDIGVMLHGRARGRIVTYAVGVFDSNDAVDTTRASFDDDKGATNPGRTAAGRVTVQPFDAVDRLPRGLRNLEFGVNATWSSVPEGLNGLVGRSVYRHRFFAPVYLNGDRVRTGVDAALLAGPVSLKAEWMRVSDERRGQGLGDVDLPDAVARAWYVAGTWLVTGETKDGSVVPRRPLMRGGIGALELALRIERLGFGSASTAGEPAFANPRAANLLANRDDVITIGLTWYMNRWFKLQGNAIHESFDDIARAPIAGRGTYWSYVGRVQFAL